MLVPLGLVPPELVLWCGGCCYCPSLPSAPSLPSRAAPGAADSLLAHFIFSEQFLVSSNEIVKPLLLHGLGRIS